MITTRRAAILAAVLALSTVTLALAAAPVGAQEEPPPEDSQTTTTTVAFTADDLAVPPEPPSEAELAYWATQLPCPTLGDLAVLRGPEADTIDNEDAVGADFAEIRVTCSYGPPDSRDLNNRVSVSFVKPNGTEQQFCREEDTHAPGETNTYGSLHSETHAVEAGYNFSNDLSSHSDTFAEGARTFLTTAEAHALRCRDPRPASSSLPERELPQVLASALPDDAPGREGSAGAPAAPAESPSDGTTSTASTLFELMGIAAIVLSIGALAIAVMTIRRESRVRTRFDVGRLVVSVVGAVIVGTVLAVGTHPALIVGGLTVGGVIGFVQGQNLELRISERGPMARRTAVGVAAWGVGMVVALAAGLANRADIVRLGLGLSAFSIGLTAGLIAGRSSKLREAHSRAAPVAAGVLLVVAAALGPVAASGVAGAQDEDVAPEEGPHPAVLEVADDLATEIDWSTVLVRAGPYASTGAKPPLPVALGPGQPAPPPAQHSGTFVQDSTGATVTFDETYTFEAADDGLRYSVAGTYTFDHPTADGADETWDLEVSDLTVSFDGFESGLPFGPADRAVDPETSEYDACRRRVSTNTPETASTDASVVRAVRNGEDATERIADQSSGPGGLALPGWNGASMDVRIPCEPVSDVFNLDFVTNHLGDLEVTDEDRAQPTDLRNEVSYDGCPVFHEAVDSLRPESENFASDGALLRLLESPTEPVCSFADTFIERKLDFGAEGPGLPKIQDLEWIYAVDQPSQAVADAWYEEEQSTLLSGFNAAEEQGLPECTGTDADGMPFSEDDPESLCRSWQQASVDDRDVTVYFDNDVADGPNVRILVRSPIGVYSAFFHHYTPDDPVVRETIENFEDLLSRPAGTLSGDDFEGAVAGPTVGDEGRPADAETGDDLSGIRNLIPNDISDPDAFAAALAGLLASGILAGTSLTQAGIDMADLSQAWRTGGRQGVINLLQSPPPSGPATITVNADDLPEGWQVGDEIPIPGDQQWGTQISGGGTTVVDDPIGTRGTVTRVGGVVKDPESGERILILEVEPRGTPTPPPSEPVSPSETTTPTGDPSNGGEGPAVTQVSGSATSADNDGTTTDTSSTGSTVTDEPAAPPPDTEPTAVETTTPEPAATPPPADPTPPVDPTPPLDPTAPAAGDPGGVEPAPAPVDGQTGEVEPTDRNVGDEAQQGAADPVGVTDREIDDMVRWGMDNGRSPDDIRRDIEGLNQARGGTGPIDISDRVTTVDTPDGPVLMTPEEAERYRDLQDQLEGIRERAGVVSDRLKDLNAESGKWVGWEQAYVMRTVAATQEMFEMHGELEATIQRINDERDFLARPRDPVLQGPYSSTLEADEMYARRHERLDQLNRMEHEAKMDFLTRVRAMTDPNPAPGQEVTSMMNRPAANLEMIGDEQERLTDALRFMNGLVRDVETEMNGLTQRPVDPS